MRLSRRFALVGSAAALLPLLVFGALAIQTLRAATQQSVTDGMVVVTRRTADQMEQWLERTTAEAIAIGSALEGVALPPWQRERALRQSLLAYPEFRELTLFTAAGTPLVSTRIALHEARLPVLDAAAADARGLRFSRITVDDDLLPTLHLGVPVRGGGAQELLVGTLNLEQIWRVVDALRVGARGFALLTDGSGRLIAHGDPDRKHRIARGEHVYAHPLAQEALARRTNEPLVGRYVDDDGREQLAVAARLAATDWLLVLEQPADEAFALANRLQRLLVLAIAGALVIMVAIGGWLGRSLIEPIGRLVTGTEAVAGGELSTRVSLGRDDEFRRLGDAFNTMAGRLEQLQEETRRQERQAMFGRIAGGLVHDFSHPVQNLANSCRLLLRRPDDLEYREVFRRTVERESATMKRVLDDLRQLGRPTALERFPIEITRHVADVAESMRAAAEASGVRLECATPDGPIHVMGDAFALGRVWRNLLQNALDATPKEGRVTTSVTRSGERANIAIADTGSGIEPERIGRLFDELFTTKRRGLGLGLAVCKRIVEQLGGHITVDSAVGSGSTFTVRLPLAPAREGAGTDVRDGDSAAVS